MVFSLGYFTIFNLHVSFLSPNLLRLLLILYILGHKRRGRCFKAAKYDWFHKSNLKTKETQTIEHITKTLKNL